MTRLRVSRRLTRGGVALVLAISAGSAGALTTSAAYGGEFGASASMSSVSTSISVNVAAYRSAAADLRFYASKIRSTTSVTVRRSAVNTVLAKMDQIRPMFSGTAAYNFARDRNYVVSYSSQSLWFATAAKLDQIAGKLDAVADAYLSGENAMAKYW